MTEFVIAIDGPSGTGKSTVARKVAASLGAGYLDTGAMYRIVTLAVLDADIDPYDDDAVAGLLERLTFVSPTDPDAQQHLLDGTDVGGAIRTAEVTSAVSPVSANPAVRAWLKGRQQELAAAGRMVVEGRDIGTVITPDATLKIYLTADERVRALRRHSDKRIPVRWRSGHRPGVAGPARCARLDPDARAPAGRRRRRGARLDRPRDQPDRGGGPDARRGAGHPVSFVRLPGRSRSDACRHDAGQGRRRPADRHRHQAGVVPDADRRRRADPGRPARCCSW